MDRDHQYYELRQALLHRMNNESKWYALPQFTKDYPALVYFHLHFKLLSRGWRNPEHLTRLSFRDSVIVPSHSYIQFHLGGWMTVFTYGVAMRGPPRMLMRQVVRMDLHPHFAVLDMAGDRDFAIFNRMCGGWVKEQTGIEAGHIERPEWKSKLDGTSPYDPLPALVGFK